jgi:hypothetical protein
MKQTLAILAFSLSLTAAPVQAIGIDVGTLVPTLTFPAPAPAPVTQEKSAIRD